MRRASVAALIAILVALLGGFGTYAAGVKLEKIAFGTGIEDVGASTFRLVGEGDRFPTSVAMVWCFARLTTYTKVLAAAFEWYTPEGDLYFSDRLGSLDSGYVWSLKSGIHVSGYAASAHPGTWTVRLRITPGRDYTARFELYGPPPVVAPPSTTPAPAPAPPSPSPPAPAGVWKVDGYALKVVDSIRTPYSASGAHIMLVVERPDGQGWEIVEGVNVDTGAAETMLPLEFAQTLGIDPRSGKRIELSGIAGTGVGWEHTLNVGIISLGGGDVDGYILGKGGKPFLFTIPIVFYGQERKLLGRAGVLSQLELTFGERMLTITVRPQGG